MPIEHKDIPDAQLHEPKGIISAVNKSVQVANGLGTGAWRRMNDVDLDYSDKTKNLYGWVDIADSLYTSGSPRAIAAATRTKLTNNGLLAQTDTSRLPGLWDTTNNQFLINDLNASYTLRVQCKVKAAAAAGTPYVVKFEVESANGPTVVSATDLVIKGGSYENAVSYSTLLYNGSFINNQALSIYVTSDTPITLYQIGFTLQRTYKET